MAQNWSKFVNKNFYGQDGSYKDNTETVEFKSGRTIRYLKNSVPKKTHAVNLRCKDKGTLKIDGKTEFEWFLNWYESTARSGAEPIYLTDITSGTGVKQYLIKVSGWKGQKYKEISLQLEEV